MQKFILPAAILIVLIAGFRSPGNKQDGYDKLDTLKFYDGSASAINDGKKMVYKVNDVVVSKEEYDKFNSVWHNIDKCKPCYLEHYTADDKLVAAGVQYTDCRVGDWKEFYPDGSVKISGHYKENHTGNWKSIFARGYCSVKDGDWISYSPKGDTTSVENYKEGKLQTK